MMMNYPQPVKIYLKPGVYEFNSTEISPLVFGKNYDHTCQFLKQANEEIKDERKFFLTNRCGMTCLCICCAMTIIGLIPFCCWICKLQKKTKENLESIKKKMNKLIEEHQPSFHENGSHVIFNEEIKYHYGSKGRRYTEIQFYVEFSFGQPIISYSQGLPTNNMNANAMLQGPAQPGDLNPAHMVTNNQMYVSNNQVVETEELQKMKINV